MKIMKDSKVEFRNINNLLIFRNMLIVDFVGFFLMLIEIFNMIVYMFEKVNNSYIIVFEI